MTLRLDLLFRRPKKGHLPASPIAWIYVKYYGDEDGYQVVTPCCISLREIEEEIDRLKKELEVIRKKAKEQFAKVT